MCLGLASLPLFVLACEPVVRPTPRDGGLDAPIEDAPPSIDANACAETAGYYMGTSTCPALDDASFSACVSRSECTASVHLATSAAPADITFSGSTGTFVDGALATDVTCTAARLEGNRMRFDCTDRLGIGCTVSLVRRDTTASGVCCLSASDCETPAACTLVAFGGGPPITTACVERTGTVGSGAACTRAGSGEDDCAAGLYCTPLGSASGTTCRALCRSTSDCGASEACIATGTVPAVGFCAPSCDLFAAGGCGAGLSCQPIAAHPTAASSVLSGVCAASGVGELGALCELDGCVPGLFCARNPLLELRCATPCDAEHPCTTGTCSPLADGSALGTCQGSGT